MRLPERSPAAPAGLRPRSQSRCSPPAGGWSSEAAAAPSGGCARSSGRPVYLIAALCHRCEPPPVSVSVVTVDDQPVFRAVARDVIDATPGFELVGEASSGETAVSVVGELDPQ